MDNVIFIILSNAIRGGQYWYLKSSISQHLEIPSEEVGPILRRMDEDNLIKLKRNADDVITNPELISEITDFGKRTHRFICSLKDELLNPERQVLTSKHPLVAYAQSLDEKLKTMDSRISELEKRWASKT